MMESVDNLRKSLQACRRTEKTEKPFDTYWITASACDQLIDEIEREVAERYMELPVDADGVPIRVGDVIGSDCEIPSRVTGMECAWSVEDEPGWNLYWGNVMHYGSEDTDWGVFHGRPSTYRHAKPRTVEDVLEEFIAAYDEWDCNTYDDERMAVRRELFAKYADELRELMEVD